MDLVGALGLRLLLVLDTSLAVLACGSDLGLGRAFAKDSILVFSPSHTYTLDA